MIEIVFYPPHPDMHRAPQHALFAGESAANRHPERAATHFPEDAGAAIARKPTAVRARAESRTHEKKKQGLGYWMRRVLKEDRRAAKSFEGDVVHDLRVALRRCRSIARAMREVEGGPRWRAVKRIGRKVFRRLGELRDAQVMKDWIVKLAPENDPVRQALLDSFSAREEKLAAKCRKAVAKFNRKRWKKLIPELAERSLRLELDSLEAQHLASRRLAEAHRMHWHALRSGTPAAWHAVRIGLKRFRYVVENFLPARHAQWGEDLKHLQDLLGEVHDLDVLWDRLREEGTSFVARQRSRWRRTIRRGQTARLAEYRAMMTGKNARWKIWRAGLAAAAPPEPRRARRVTRPVRAAASASPSKRAAHAAA